LIFEGFTQGPSSNVFFAFKAFGDRGLIDLFNHSSKHPGVYVMCQYKKLAFVFALLWGTVAYATDGQEVDKKLIHLGWDSMSPGQLEAKMDDLQHLPFDGLSVRSSYGHAFYNRDELAPERVEAGVQTMSRIKWGKFTDNLMWMNAGAHSQWFNDAAWADDGHIIRNIRALARMGKAGKCKGVIFDPEFINPEQEHRAGPWNYGYQALHKEKSIDEYRAMVRRRGAQFIDAIESEMPDPVFLTLYWGHYGVEKLAYDTDPKLINEIVGGEEYGLLHDFMLGVLEGADEGTMIIDGNEPSYYANHAKAFEDANHFTHHTMLNSIPEDLHDKYREQVSIGHAIYADHHSSTRDGHSFSTYMTPEERALGMERIVYLAMKHSDKYVWFFSEKPRYLHDELVEPVMIPAIARGQQKVAANETLGFDFEPVEQRASAAYRRASSGDIVPLTAVVARATASPPELDGKLDDEIWGDAIPLGPFQSFLTASHQVKSQAMARMVYDDTNLYVAFRCDIHEPRTKFDATDIDEDNVQRGRGDLVEVGVATDAQASAYYHIRLTYHNRRWDALTPASVWPNEISGQDDSWDAAYETATYTDPDLAFWTAELVIPWACLNRRAPEAGDPIKGNLIVRTDRPASHGSYQLLSWSPMRRNRLIEADSLGTWQFE